MQTRILTPLSQVASATRQITTASRQPGYKKVVYRVQGFVFGALFVTLINLIGRFLFTPNPQKATAMAVAWTTAVLAALVYAWFVASIDRNEKEPWHMLLVAFLWGTVVSGTIAGLLNTVARDIYQVTFSVAPYTEELTKGAILFLIYWYASGEFDNALDGIIYGAMVGIGFAMKENASYFLEKAPSAEIIDQMQSNQFFLRVVLKGLAGHATYTAIIGLGLGLSRQVQRRWLKILLPILGLATAVTAHALWNSDAARNLLDLNTINSRYWGITARVALINGPFFVGMIVAVLLSWRKESKIIAEQLTDELDPNDIYTAPLMMYTVKKRFVARWQIFRARGFRAWKVLKQLQRALIELAFCKAHYKEDSLVRDRIQSLRGKLEVSM